MSLQNQFTRQSAEEAFARAKSEFEKAAAALVAAQQLARASGKMITSEMEAAGVNLRLAQQRLSEAKVKLNEVTGGPAPLALTEAVSRKVQQLFAAEEQPQAIRLLEKECGRNLPFHEESDGRSLERIRLAVLKLSAGDLQELKRHIEVAKVDWRDVLVAANV